MARTPHRTPRDVLRGVNSESRRSSRALKASEPKSFAPSSRRLVAAGLVGNVLEWYDFSIYGYFAAMVGETFFPSHNPTTSLIAAFGVFSAGFITRPLGALLFGYIGDRHSRERSLTLSIVAMAIPTCVTGLLPGYATIGLAAPVIMVALRLIQGLSAGGEYTTSIVFLIERSGQARRGFMGSFGLFGSIAGGMLGSALGAALTFVMPQEQIYAWGWRLPFIFGLAPAFVGVMIRRELAQLADYEPPSRTPIGRVLVNHWRAIIKVFGFEILEGVGFYTTFIYLTTYFTRVAQVPQRNALTVNTLCMGLVLLIIPASGALSDRIGRKPLLLAAAAAMALFAWPLFRLMHRASFGAVLAAELSLALIIGLYEGTAPATAAEAFPMGIRATGVAVAFNSCMTLFGGTTPMAATYLIALTGSSMAPAGYLIVAAVIAAGFVLSLGETGKAPLAS